MNLMKHLFACALLCGCLTGCFNEKDLVKRFLPKEDDAMARRFIEAVRAADYDTVTSMMDPKFRDAKTMESAKAIHGLLDHGKPLAFEPVGYWVHQNASTNAKPSRQVNVTYEIQLPGYWVVATVILNRSSGADSVVGFNVQQLFASLETINRFTLAGKSLKHYFFLLMAVVIPVFILGVLVVCVRSRIRRKWLWAILVLLGGGQFRLDWTSGNWDFQQFNIVLLGSSFLRSGAGGSWVLSFAVPAGAILFLVFRRSLIVRTTAPSPPPPPAAAPAIQANDEPKGDEPPRTN